MNHKKVFENNINILNELAVWDKEIIKVLDHYKAHNIVALINSLTNIIEVKKLENTLLMTSYKEKLFSCPVSSNIFNIKAIIVDSLIGYMQAEGIIIQYDYLSNNGFQNRDFISKSDKYYKHNILYLINENINFVDADSINEISGTEIRNITKLIKKLSTLNSNDIDNTSIDSSAMYSLFSECCSILLNYNSVKVSFVDSLIENMNQTNYFTNIPSETSIGYSNILKSIKSNLSKYDSDFYTVLSSIENYISDLSTGTISDLIKFSNSIVDISIRKSIHVILNTKQLYTVHLIIYTLVKTYIHLYSIGDKYFYELNEKIYNKTKENNESGEKTFLNYIAEYKDKELTDIYNELDEIEYENKLEEAIKLLSNPTNNLEKLINLNCDQFHSLIYITIGLSLFPLINDTYKAIEKLNKSKKENIKKSSLLIMEYISIPSKESDISNPYLKLLNKYKDKAKKIIALYTYVVMQNWSLKTFNRFNIFNNFIKLYSTAYNYAKFTSFNSLESINFDKEFSKMESAAKEIRSLIDDNYINFLHELYEIFIYEDMGFTDSGCIELLKILGDTGRTIGKELTLNIRNINTTLNPKKIILDAILYSFTQAYNIILVDLFVNLKIGDNLSIEDIYVSLNVIKNLLNNLPDTENYTQQLYRINNSKKYKNLKKIGFGVFYYSKFDSVSSMLINDNGFTDTLLLKASNDFTEKIIQLYQNDKKNFNDEVLYKKNRICFSLIKYLQHKYFKTNNKGSILSDIQKIKKLYREMNLTEMKIFIYEFVVQYGIGSVEGKNFDSIYKYPELKAFKKYYKYSQNEDMEEYLSSVNLFFENNKEFVIQFNEKIQLGLSHYSKQLLYVEDTVKKYVSTELNGSELYSWLVKFYPTTDILFPKSKETLLLIIDWLLNILDSIFNIIKELSLKISNINNNSLTSLNNAIKSHIIYRRLEKVIEFSNKMYAWEEYLIYVDKNFKTLFFTCSI